MDFTVKNGNLSKQPSACIIVCIFEGRKISATAKQLDKLSGGYLKNIIKAGDIQGKTGQTLLLHDVPKLKAERVLLVGCGKERGIDAARFRKIVTAMSTALTAANIKDAICCLTELTVKGHDLSWKINQTIQLVRNNLYRFEQFKSKNSRSKQSLRRITLSVAERSDLKPSRAAIAIGQSVANGMDLAKDLGNLPGNVCTPNYLASQARTLAKEHRNLRCNVLNETDMKRLKMGSLLSVTHGSRQPAKLITLNYSGGNRGEQPVVLVGKGVTFDSGGVSIKPSPAMDEMKYDMCGAASVFGTIRAVAELQLPINVVGVVPACENMPDGNASKPGDIVTSMSGQTIEVLNTDAEGRLILCDALTYSARFKPDVIIDIATLTGACVMALGSHATGLLSNHSNLSKDLQAAGNTAHDRVWEMPLWDEYQQQLDSNFADMANIGGREAGTITAACFLSRFTEDYNWAHLDIAGTAWLGGAKKGATGRPVPLLVQYLLDKCN